MNQLHGEASPADIPSTPQQAQDVLTEVDNLAKRSARDPSDLAELLKPGYNDEDYFYHVPAKQVPPEIAERFIDPPVDDLSVFCETDYHLSVSRPRDEFDAPKKTDESWVAWISLVRELRKPNGVSYSSPVTYTVVSESNAPLYHLERHTEIEKHVPKRITESALMLHLAAPSENEDDLPTEQIRERMAEYTRVYESLDDPLDEDLLEELAKLERAAIDREFGIDRTTHKKSLTELAAGDDLAREYGFKDVNYAEADAILRLLRPLDLLDQS